jgi:5-methylcytosine-specific restriction endonuclease McrA
MNRPFSKVLALDPGGTPKDWISYKDAILYAATNSIAWVPPTAKSLTVFGGTNAKTGLPSSVEIASILAIRGPMAAKLDALSGKAPRVSNKALFARDFHRCAYCGGYFDEHELTKDHIIPKKHKGKNTWMNLITACKPCNGKKADRTPEKAGMKLLYKPYVPSRVDYLYFANRSIADEQLDYIELFANKKKAA